MSAASFVILGAQPADLEAIAEIERHAFSDPWSRQSFATVIGEPAAHMVVARDAASNELEGYVVAWFAADEGEIGNLAVRQPTRRRGIGAALLDAALTEAARRGATTMYLEVRESNEAARALYAARGFEEVGRRKKYYHRPPEDAIVLRRQAEKPT